MEAARRFDPERNVKFITYAVWWVRQAIMHALSGQTRAFSLAAEAVRRGRAVRSPGGGARPSSSNARRRPREIAQGLAISEADVDALRRIGTSDVSLSEQVGGADAKAWSWAICSSRPACPPSTTS